MRLDSRVKTPGRHVFYNAKNKMPNLRLMKKLISALVFLTSFATVSILADQPASTNNSPSGVQELSAKTNKIILTVVRADGEETSGEDGKASNAEDGNTGTIWRTQWQDANPAHP